MTKMGDSRIIREAEARGFNENQVKTLRQEVVDLYDQLSEGTLKTF